MFSHRTRLGMWKVPLAHKHLHKVAQIVRSQRSPAFSFEAKKFERYLALKLYQSTLSINWKNCTQKNYFATRY